MTPEFLTFKVPDIQGTYSSKFIHSCSIALKCDRSLWAWISGAGTGVWLPEKITF